MIAGQHGWGALYADQHSVPDFQDGNPVEQPANQTPPVQQSTLLNQELADDLFSGPSLSLSDLLFHPAPQDTFPPVTGDSLLPTTDSIRVLDSLGLPDSLAKLDSIQADTVKIDSLALDSTARIAHYKYKPIDKPYLSLYERKSTAFLASPTAKRRIIEIDSSGQFVEIKEKLGEITTKIVLRMPLEEYISAKLKSREQQLWDDIAYKYELKSDKKDLSQLIRDFTDFEIPLPSMGVLSIFGPPVISLKIGGAVDIHAAWRNETTEGVTASRLGNTKNEPDFKQQVQLNVNGTIGDKLTISADWNTERTFEYENQLKIKYTGYEDEIIQSIEAGNVSLQTSPLVGGSEALFGVKALFKMGPFSLTALASQKKGEVKEKSLSGGSSSQDFNVRAYDYSTNHFFVHKDYADTTLAELNLFHRYYGNSTPDINRAYTIKQIEVWKSINQTINDPNERNANCYIDLPPLNQGQTYSDALRAEDINEVTGEIVKGRFILLKENIDYVLRPETGFITFRSNIQESEIIAVAFQRDNTLPGPEDDLLYGEFLNQSAGADTARRLVLQLVKPQNLQPQMKTAWSLLLKNIYPIGGRNIKKENFELNIKYEVDGQEPQTSLGNVQLLNVFGLDLYGESNTPPPDGKFDYRVGITVLPESGEIIFPYLQPFGLNMAPNIPDVNTRKFQAVYDTSKTFARQDKTKDKWIISGKFSGDVTSVYQLGFNLVENSVKVFLNGRELSAGSDYSVDYNIGQLTIRNEAALVPGANLRITYEENDLALFASKTLFGARGLYEFSKKTQLGFSFLNYSQQTLSDKVRIGEEPISNTIYGLDFNTSIDLPVVTKLLDNIISTKEMSSLTLRGEFAYMDPDPNTKKSTISSDLGESIAYIDDFEGAKRIIPVGISYGAWKDLSIPAGLPTLGGIPDTAKMRFKGRSWWFNVLPTDVEVEEIWPEKRVARGDEQVTVLDAVFKPDTFGTYNYYPDLTDPTRSWGGLMKVLSSTANNLVDENIEFIEFWFNVRRTPDGAKMYIDLGKISEDVIPNNRLDKEDLNGNELIDEGEDTGIDGILDPEERARYGIGRNDPAGDNFAYQSGSTQTIWDYYNINGTQGNAQLTDIGLIPDTEDLNRNGTLDAVNSFFRYEVPIDTNSATNPFIAGGGNNDSWYLMRIPLKDYTEAIGSPSFSIVENIRVFFTGVSDLVHLRITEFNLVGNQWQKLIKEDSVLSISVVSIEDNPDYKSPPGVQRERDRSRPDQEVYRNEQALNLIIRDLQDGESREAVKYLFRPLDVFNYKTMKLFIHGNENDSLGSISYYVDENNYSAEAYFKFGTDTNNFYEYRQPIKKGWNEITIPFEKLTAIKQIRDSANVEYRLDVGIPGHYYVVRGNPSLTSVKFLSIGIHNTNNPNISGPISGQLWVNELRVIGADDTPGWAYTASSAFKIADLMTLNFNISQTDPFFHRLTERFGSRIDSRNWGLSADVDVLKLMPVSLPGSNLRVNYAHTESVGDPIFVPGTDIRISEAQEIIRQKEGNSEEGNRKAEELKTNSQTLSISDTYTFSNIQFKLPYNHWLAQYSINSLTFGFNYNKTFSRNPSVESTISWIWNANINYGITLSPDNYFFLRDIPLLGTLVTLIEDYKDSKFYFSPQNFSWTITARRNATITTTRPTLNTDAQTNTSRDFTATRGFRFSWKFTELGFLNPTFSYNADATSSLAYLETDAWNRPRSESEIWAEILGGDFFGRDVQYGQSVDLRLNPRVPSWFDLNRFLTLTAGYNVRYTWRNDLLQPVLGRSATVSNRTTLGFKVRLKAIFDPLFAEDPESVVPVTPKEPERKGRTRDFDLEDGGEEKKGTGLPSDSTDIGNVDLALQGAVEDSIDTTPRRSVLTSAWMALRAGIKYVLFDYENISIDVNNETTFGSSGIKARGTGFLNFWGVSYNEDSGPGRGFMFGLSNDVGARAPNGNLSDDFSEKNDIELRTSRPLWEGAKIDLNWKVGWSMNKRTTIETDINGDLSITGINSSGTLNRSFMALPPVLIFSVFKNGIKKVHELYNPNSGDATASLSSAFIEGMETFPLISKLGFMKEVISYIPRPNWRVSWEGLEKIGIFKSFAKRVSLDHAYTSEYSEGWKISPEGRRITQTQRISYGFSPLLQLNMTFNDLWEGNLTGSVKYNTRTTYDLGVTSKNITEGLQRDIGISINYSKSGFELPLFGVSLKNDIEFSFSYTLTKNSSVVFDMDQFKEDGTPQNGTNTITIEPRIRYVISSRVTLALFYKRVQTEPEGAARIPPTTRNEAGLDIRISIQ